MSRSASVNATQWKLAAGALTLGSTALLVLWRRVFRAKPDRPVSQAELDAVRSRALTLRDGRVLQYYEFGPRDGRPTVFLHGMMATGRRFERWVAEFERHGIRAICPTLPGWGLSDPVRDRRLIDYPADIEQLVDHLQIERFDVIGVSFGGMHAAAVAAYLPERVLHAALMGAHCPPDLPGFDITRCGMNPFFNYSARMLRFAPWLADPLAFAVKQLANRETRRASAYITFNSPDYKYMADWPPHKRRECTDFFGDIMAESMARTHFGYVDCARLATLQPWGFDPRHIRCPTLIVGATNDDSTPLAMQQRLAGLVPHNRLVTYRGGHLVFNLLFPLMLHEWVAFTTRWPTPPGSAAFHSAFASLTAATSPATSAADATAAAPADDHDHVSSVRVVHANADAEACAAAAADDDHSSSLTSNAFVSV